MIGIQIFLIVVLVLIMGNFLASQNSSRTKAWKKMLLLAFFAAAIFIILLPDSMNRIAHAMGVGRGADLLLYGLTMAFIFMQLNSYVKSKQEQRRLVVLARKVAILDALQEQKS